MKVNIIYNENCLDTMKNIPDCFIDLIITSPPYDNLRQYNGFVFEFEKIALEIYRITKLGGVLVWLVGDATVNGSETCTSFKQAIYFVERCHFLLNDTMIYVNKYPMPKPGPRYTQSFEYMFIFSKGKPKTFNPFTERCKHAGAVWKSRPKTKDCAFDAKVSVTKDRKPISNVWIYNPKLNDKTSHPATNPESLIEDHILTWSNLGDLVYDPFMGSGTVAKMCKINNRYFIGSEISKDYCDEANRRISIVNAKLFN